MQFYDIERENYNVLSVFEDLNPLFLTVFIYYKLKKEEFTSLHLVSVWVCLTNCKLKIGYVGSFVNIYIVINIFSVQNLTFLVFIHDQ